MLAATRAVVLGSFNPLKLGTDLIAYWDARRLDLMTLGAGKAVSSWNDIVAGYAATQGTGSSQPIYSATSFGGDPGVAFDGIDDNLTATAAGLLAALPGAAAPSEIWLLMQQDALVADASTRHFVNYGSTNSNTARSVARTGFTGANRGEGLTGSGAATSAVTDATVNLSTRHVLRWEIAAAASRLTVDGDAPASVSVVPSTTVSRLRLGANAAASAANFAQGQISVALVTNPLSASKAAALQSWLLARRRV